MSTAEVQICQAVAQAHFPEGELVGWQKLTGGVSADVYRLDLARPGGIQSTVLRIHGATHSGHPAELEFALLQWLQQSGLKVAAPLACDVSGEVIEQHYLLLAFVEGSTAVAPAESDQAIEKMAAALRKIHKLSVNELPELPKRLEPIPGALEYLPEGNGFHHLRNLLANFHSKFMGPVVLLHGDFWPENVMWSQGNISAVLDWEDAALGDALSDVACTMLELRYLYGAAGANRFLAAYSQGKAIDDERLALWQIHVAAAAQKYMGQWGLPADKEAHMRSTALTVIHEAAQYLHG